MLFHLNNFWNFENAFVNTTFIVRSCKFLLLPPLHSTIKHTWWNFKIIKLIRNCCQLFVLCLYCQNIPCSTILFSPTYVQRKKPSRSTCIRPTSMHQSSSFVGPENSYLQLKKCQNITQSIRKKQYFIFGIFSPIRNLWLKNLQGIQKLMESKDLLNKIIESDGIQKSVLYSKMAICSKVSW